jgi:spore maturation protein A
MKVVGPLLRYVLNINTIWGAMIVISFLLCVVQHYLPTTTTIGASCFSAGANAVTIRVTDSKKQTQSFAYTLNLRAGELLIADADRVVRSDRPWLISALRAGSAFLLKWDTGTYGTYDVAVGDAVVGRGRLVTLQSLTDAAFDYAKSGFDVALGLVAAMVLFLGLMKVGEAAGIVQLVARLFHPVVRLLFPDVPRDHPASGAILMNMTTSVLGLGNAATPFGLKAMLELQSLNPHPKVASDSQVMLLGYNTAGFALLPTTLLALRKSAGCTDPFEVIGTAMVAGAVATVAAIIAVKLLGMLRVFSKETAVAEQLKEETAAGTAGDAGAGDKR